MINYFSKKTIKNLEYSFAEDPDSDDRILVRIDNTDFKGTIFSIDKVSITGEKNLSVGADILFVPEDTVAKYKQKALKRKLDRIIITVVSDTI